MYTIVQTKELSAALALVKPCVSAQSKGTDPHILMTSDCTSVTLTATDRLTHVTTRIDGSSTSLGSASIPYTLFAASVAATNNPTMALQQCDAKISLIDNGRTNAILPVDDQADMFIQFDKTPRTVATIASSNLRTLIRTTAYASSPKKDYRSSLFHGVLCETHHDMLRFVSTDAYRLAVTTRPCIVAESWEPMHDIIIPVLALRKLEKMLPKISTPVVLRVSELGGALSCTWNNTTLVIQTTQGSYMPWSKLFPTAHETRLTFSIAAFLQAIKDIMPIAQRGDNALTLSISAENSTVLTLSAMSSDASVSASRTVQCDCTGSSLATIRVNYLYLLETFASFDRSYDKASIDMTTKDGDPLVVMAHDDALNKAVIMPVRLVR